jgi:hypothetical protein
MGNPMLFVANVVGAPSADKVEAAHDKKFCQALVKKSLTSTSMG